jgi:DNA-binding CsgD family transcriptional regulator
MLKWTLMTPGDREGTFSPSLDEIRGGRFSFAGQRFAVLSFPIAGAISAPTLSPTEREVLRLVLEGMRNAQIAARRGTSVRTVANQVASLFRKLGVTCRRELLAILAAG